MKRSVKRFLAVLAAVIAVCAGVAGYYLREVAIVAAGYKAKNLCSAVFVSGREPEAVLSEDLLPAGPQYPLRFIDVRIDHAKQRVTASFEGFAERTAVFREGFGCTLEIGDIAGKAAPAADLPGSGTKQDANATWPDGEFADTVHRPSELNGEKLDQAIDWAFSETGPGRLSRTRALVVVYDGRIVAERYAPGFSASTPLPGWSMAKSVFAALTGILTGEGKISLESNALLPQWHDGRKSITLDNLLRMSSGLAFEELYSSPLSDVVVMLFGIRDTASFAAEKPLVSGPGTKWQYSSGTTNIISGIMRNIFGNSRSDYLQFPRRALFDRIGMRSAVVEPDSAGNFVASSFMYATARDWARFGLLYLRDGMWGDERVLPKGWVQYCTTPAPASVSKDYGAQFWLQVPREFRKGEGPDSKMPPDAYHAVGYDGQFVSIIPSRKLVVVRLGLTRPPGAWDQEELIGRILDSLR